MAYSSHRAYNWIPPSKVGSVLYTPGETGRADFIRLNTNEAPWPPPESVIGAIADTARNGHFYPDPTGEPLRTALARHHGVPETWILVSSGADGLLDGCFRAFVRAGDAVQVWRPTYPVIHLLCATYGAQTISSSWPPRTDKDDHPVITFVVNPNSPTGAWIPPITLKEYVCRQHSLVVIDEAYAPFAGESMIDAIAENPHQLVIRTFSKAYSLAGLRVGYAVGVPDVISELRAAHLPYPTSSCALAAGVAALSEPEQHREMVAFIVNERARVSERLQALGWEVPQSYTNFLYARPPDGSAGLINHKLAEAGILVRYFPKIDPEWMRISIGNASDNNSLLQAITSSTM